MLIALASVCTFIAVLFIMYSLSQRQPNLVEARMTALQTGMRPREITLAQPFMVRAVAPAIQGLSGFLVSLLPTSWIVRTSERLRWSGMALSIEGFVLIWVLAAVGLPLGTVYWTELFSIEGMMRILLIGGAFVVGAFYPQMWLRSRIAARHHLARKELPDAVDLMVTSVEAGLSLDAALLKVSEYHSGPLQRELQRALNDMNLGQSRREALEAMTQRLNLPELVNFVQTLNQAEVTGAPIGQVLRVQAESIRTRRRQLAEAQAQRAPLLMIGPLVFLIFPSLFIVLLGPAAMTIIDIFNNSEVFGR
jgi:tight adherence protein C